MSDRGFDLFLWFGLAICGIVSVAVLIEVIALVNGPCSIS
jgi:hypothetical protein